MAVFFVNFILFLTDALTIAIFIRAIISWFPISRGNPIVELVFQVTEPVLSPIRRVVPTLGFIDLTPLVAIFVLQLIRQVAVVVI